ncbi:peptidoglycan-binding protein [Archangium violaceum]|uniref:C40 family peptidase n=1 Tax=Archangium violaceum TaxID=83451 RepID=UPI001952697C|nr:peptidoglycan-binding protein [Archangium violaceum]QRN97395.1 peptidoglycan-binding protein [Archangium violaceum]
MATPARSLLPTLQLGSRGPDVRELQTLLNGKGFDCGTVDGVFGPKTQAAVEAFQRAEKITVDGIAGPQVWDRLEAQSPTLPLPPPGSPATAEAFVQMALSQAGDRYVFGAEVRLDDPNPEEFDCSELVQWAAHQVGVSIPDGTMNQLPHIQRAGKEISVERAFRTRGALLFRPGHVAISLGDGRTIEAKGSQYGVGVFSAHGRKWTTGGLIPGLMY